MKRKMFRGQRGQGLVEYALLLSLVSVAAIFGLELFGDAVQTEYCKVLTALGTTEAFCPSGNNGESDNSDDEGDPSDSGDPGDANDPGDDSDAGSPGDDDSTGDPGDGGNPGDTGGDEPGPGDNDSGDDEDTGDDEDEGGDGDGDDEGGNQPPQDEPDVPGILRVTKVNTKNNKNFKQIKYRVTYNGGYEPNVVVTAHFNGKSVLVPPNSSHNFYDENKYQNAGSFPVTVTFTATKNGKVLATLACEFQGISDENGNGDYC